MLDKTYKTYFIYLENLRRSGITNMYGAVPYLMETFPYLTKSKAANILKLWMVTYDPADYKNIK